MEEPSIQSLGIDRLPLADRFRLLDDLWQNIAADPSPQVPEWHRAILDQRLAEFERDPEAGSSWEEVEARLREQP